MTIRSAALGLALVSSLLIPSAAFAQAAPPPPPPAQEGKAEFTFVGTTGNTSTQALGLSVEQILRRSGWEVVGKAGYIRNNANDVLSAETLALGASATRALNSRVGIIGKYGFLRDEFAGTSHRHTVDVGLAVKLVATAKQTLGADGTVGYANERRLAGPDIVGATMGAGAKYGAKLTDTADLSEEFRLLASLSGESDRRWSNVLALSAKVSSVFSLKASHTVRHVNQPPTGFKATDTIMAIAIVAKY